MPTFTKKAMVLFDPKEYRQLVRMAHDWHVSTAQLIRQAVRMQFLNRGAISKEDALRTLTQDTGIAFSWSRWEKEYTKSKAGK